MYNAAVAAAGDEFISVHVLVWIMISSHTVIADGGGVSSTHLLSCAAFAASILA
jgi:hypothetical protein